MRLPSRVSTLDAAVEGIAAMGGRRPVYLDMQATEILHDRIGYRTAGLVSQVVPGVGAQPPQDLDGGDARLVGGRGAGARCPRRRPVGQVAQ